MLFNNEKDVGDNGFDFGELATKSLKKYTN
jgi:hypothetical protein